MDGNKCINKYLVKGLKEVGKQLARENSWCFSQKMISISFTTPEIKIYENCKGYCTNNYDKPIT